MNATIRYRKCSVNTLLQVVAENNQIMDFKGWLATEMGKACLSQSRLARMARVPQPTIFRILSGETTNPRLDTVKKIERALRVQSPQLEPVEDYPDLSAAWALLSPPQQLSVMDTITQHVESNRQVLAAFRKHKPKPDDLSARRDLRERDRRLAQAQIDRDRRQAERRN